MEEKRLYKIHITGRVQGVGFRWSALREAQQRGITGFVQNLSDGSVYIEAEAAAGQLDPFIKWCREGPRTGSVRSVTFDIMQPVNYNDFIIKH